MKLLTALLTNILLALFIGAAIAVPFEANPYIISGAIFITGLVIPGQPGCMLMAIQLSELKTELGAYFRQHKKEILRKLIQKTVTMNYMSTKSSAKGEWAMAQAMIDSIVQPFQKVWTPKGTPEFKPNIIKNYRHKVDIEIVPDEVEDSWLAFLYDEGMNRKDMPITKYILENLIFPKIMEDREKKIIGKGIFADPTPGTPGPVGTSMDGFLKKLEDGVTGSTINEVVLSPLTETNIFDQIEEFTDAIDEVYADEDMPVFLSRKWYKAYFRDKRNTHGQDPSFKLGDAVVDFTNNRLVPLPSMSGKDHIFTTPKENFIRLIDKINEVGRLEIESVDRTIKVFGDWWEGVGFGIDEAVWAFIPAGSGS